MNGLPWFEGLRQIEIDWFLARGVAPLDIASPWSIGAGAVIFDGDTFIPDATGARAFLLLVEDVADVIDVAAWRPKTGEMGSYYGTGFAIGGEQVFNPASYAIAGALAIHRDPLDWLRAGRDGIVIVRPELAYGQLAHVPRLSVAGESHGRQVWEWLQPPKPTVEIAIRESVVEEAA